MKVLSVNAGSSSLKFTGFEMPSEDVLISGVFERIGIDNSFYTIKVNGEKIKKEVGSALMDLGEEGPEPMIVHGPNRITSLPMEVPVSYQEIAHCLDKTINKIETAILAALEETPPELYADLINKGIYLAGGGALLRGLAKRLTDKIQIQFHVADDPLRAVARGTGIALKNIDKFRFLLR